MLYGSQKRFDKNGDGKLKGAEWQRWYQYAYGDEIEAKEKRRRANTAEQKRAQIAADFADHVSDLINWMYRDLAHLEGEREDQAIRTMHLALYVISAALQTQKVDESMRYLLRAFWNEFQPTLDESVYQALCAKQVLFAEIGEISEKCLGSFWRNLLDNLPPERRVGKDDDLQELLDDTSRLYNYFRDDSAPGIDFAKEIEPYWAAIRLPEEPEEAEEYDEDEEPGEESEPWKNYYEKAAPEGNGGGYYQFCKVQFKDGGSPYAYLTGGLPLAVGDFVLVPVGNRNAEKTGRVTDIFVCSAQDAPYPPEKAKFVLRKSERTAFPERTKLQHPAPKQADVSAPTESKRAVPPVQSAPIENPQKSAPTVQSAITSPIVSQTLTELEITEKKSTLSKKPFPFGKLIAAVLAVAVIAWVSISSSDRNKQRAAAYDAALQELSNGNYTSAEQDFSALSGYRDAASLSVYCKYADMYKDRTDYAGGQDELSNITLQYDTSWQQDVDALETRVKGYKAEKDAAEEAERQRIAAENAAKREQSLKDQYSGKLPVEGMPVSCLKYTSLGEPDKRLNCKNFEKLEQNQKYFNVYWYDGNGEMIAAGMCAQWRDESEFMLKTFSQYYPSGSNKGQTFHYGNGDNNSGSIRDDYDNPEDLWEDNQDWYEDEDEAWDEWENG